jgi:ankyrin repeat protein
VSKVHIGCLQFCTSRHDAVTPNFKQRTPFHLIDHTTAPLCYELTITLLAALSTEAATTLVNTADVRGNTALHGTASYKLDEHGDELDDCEIEDLVVCHTCMRALLAAGADPTVKNKAGVQAVCLSEVLTAARRDNSEGEPIDEYLGTVKALQQAGTDINVTRYNTCTEYHLHNAAGHEYSYHCSSTVRLLLDCGADVMLRNDKGWTAMQCAAYFEADHDDADGSGGKADIIQMLYDAGRHELLHSRTPDGRALLHLACRWPDSIQKLCELGAYVDERNSSNQTPLHYASASSSSACVRVLLDKGANIRAYGDAASDFKHTGSWQPLHYSVAPDIDIDIVDMLLAAGATIDVKTTTGCTAAWLLARYGSAKRVFVTGEGYSTCTLTQQLEQLCSRGANLKHYSDKHGALLHAAAGNGDVDVMKLLLEKGLTLFNTDKMYYTSKQQTPLHYAAQGGHTAMIQLLIEHGCDVTDIDTDGNSAIRLCLQGANDNAACFTVLLKAGADALDIATDTR